MDDGAWLMFAAVVLLAVTLRLIEYRDKRAGKYPRDWMD
jgi:hypothetical protein